MPILFSKGKADGSHRLGVEGSSCSRPLTPAYGSEFSTDGSRLVRALEGNGAGCRFTPRSCKTVRGAVSRFLYRPHYRRTKSESQVLFEAG
jgi:hypothetical protein